MDCSATISSDVASPSLPSLYFPSTRPAVAWGERPPRFEPLADAALRGAQHARVPASVAAVHGAHARSSRTGSARPRSCRPHADSVIAHFPASCGRGCTSRATSSSPSTGTTRGSTCPRASGQGDDDGDRGSRPRRRSHRQSELSVYRRLNRRRRRYDAATSGSIQGRCCVRALT